MSADNNDGSDLDQHPGIEAEENDSKGRIWAAPRLFHLPGNSASIGAKAFKQPTEGLKKFGQISKSAGSS